jgi:hypothetical protein
MFQNPRLVVLAALGCVLVSTAAAPTSVAGVVAPQDQEEEPGRGDDLARIRRWRSFLDRADRAFFAAHMDTAAVRAKITQADERIEELEEAAKSSEPDPGGRSDITGDVAFLERAERAFTAAHMNTAEVQRWLKEAREKT